MNEDLIGLTVTFSTLGVLLPLVLLHGTFKAQEIEDSWRKLAERHRLDFEPAPAFRSAQVTGSLAGRPFLLKKSGGGNKAGFCMELGLGGALPPGLRMKPRGRHLAAHREVLGVPESHVIERTGEVKINDEMSVKATSPEQIEEYLTAERKRAALRLADVGGELDGHKLRVVVTKHADDLEELDKAVLALAEVAPVLDGL